MSVTSRNPLRFAGACVNSGFTNTGEQRVTRGGEQVYWGNSGVSVDTVIFSGAGRLNTAILHALFTTSGKQIQLYDGVPIATSGGPFAASGHKVLATLFTTPVAQVSGAGGAYPPPSVPLQIDMPFLSGLLVSCFASGTPAFSVSYTPETNIPNPG